jgi:hypothetical protein
MNPDIKLPKHTILECVLGRIFNLKHGLESEPFHYDKALRPLNEEHIIKKTKPMAVFRLRVGPTKQPGLEPANRVVLEPIIRSWFEGSWDIISGSLSTDQTRIIISLRKNLS